MRPSPLNVPELLRRYGLRPDKSLGQNFLVDEVALERLVQAATIRAEDTVLEIGAGLGGLTRWLAIQAQRVVAVELDENLIPPLQEVLTPYSNTKIIQGDILALNPTELIREENGHLQPSYLVVANIPYYITSALIRHLLEASHPPQRLVLTLQLEVAKRICTSEGKMSLLALSVQVYGKPEMVVKISAEAFYPTPKVDSAVVRVDLYSQPLIAGHLLPLFFRLAKAGFSQKRKTLRNALAGGMRWTPQQSQQILAAAGIESQRRAETLNLGEWGQLVDEVHDLGFK